MPAYRSSFLIAIFALSLLSFPFAAQAQTPSVPAGPPSLQQETLPSAPVSLLIEHVTLAPNDTLEIEQFDPAAQGSFHLLAYRVVDERSAAPVLHPVSGDALYVRGGDRIGIASMNFDLVYNQHGYIIGLVDDVICQAVIRNRHTYPPSEDCWGSMVLFTLPYRQVAGVEHVSAYLETDFLFYTWDQPERLRTRRIVVLQVLNRYETEQITTFLPVWLALVGEDGSIEYAFTYDNPEGYFYGRYLAAREAAVLGYDYYGGRRIAADSSGMMQTMLLP